MRVTEQEYREMCERIARGARKKEPPSAIQKTFATAEKKLISGEKRLRQSEKPLLNKLETAWLAQLTAMYPGVKIHSQAKKYKLGNGVGYTPDFVATIDGKETAWETKGFFRDDAAVKLKVAAMIFPEVDWWLCWKEKGAWKTQKILS